ncbi:MAG: hypothetical protein WCJ49_09715, partial [Deltaproteobacteria bacterium]
QCSSYAKTVLHFSRKTSRSVGKIKDASQLCKFHRSESNPNTHFQDTSQPIIEGLEFEKLRR